MRPSRRGTRWGRGLAPTSLALLLACLLVLPASVLASQADAEPGEPVAAFERVRTSLSEGNATAAWSAYEDALRDLVHARDAQLASSIEAAFETVNATDASSLAYELASQRIRKGLLHAAYLDVEHHLFETGDVEAAEATLAVLEAKFGESLATARVLLEDAEHEPGELDEHRDRIRAELLGVFAAKVREEVEEARLGFDDPAERQEKAVEALAYYGPLRANASHVLGAEAERELHHELVELAAAAEAGNRSKAEHAADEALALLDRYLGREAGSDDVAQAAARLASAVELLLAEYDEYVDDGTVVDEQGYEGEIQGLFLPEVRERWATLEPLATERDAHEAEEIGELVDELTARVERTAPNADVRATAEHLLLELDELAGERDDEPASAFDAAADRFKNRLHEIARAYEAGETDRALELTRSAYLDIYSAEMETAVKANDPTLNEEIERLLNIELKGAIQSGASFEDVEATVAALEQRVDEASAAVANDKSPIQLFVDSLAIILREGFEAMLVVGAVATYLVRTDNRERLTDLWIGVGAALAATVALYFLVRTAFEMSGAQREILEGATALLAVAVLFYVSYWLINKVEVAKWNRFIQGKVRSALASGSMFALAGVAFLAVFREGLETVLFYQGLFAASGGSGAPVLGGFVVGCVVLVAAILAFYKYGVKLPLRPFFIVTSALLYYLAFTFMGAGIHEFQEAGLVPTTVIGPMADALHDSLLGTIAGFVGVYPTWETVLGQLVLVGAAAGGLVWTFHIEPGRRARRAGTD